MTTAYDCFIQKNTILTSPPLVPELKLHLANDATTLWKMTESEMKNTNLPLPFWAFAWAGGQALARYILDNPKLVKGKAVLDIGAGSGIVGLSALLSLASRVDFKEIDPFAAESIRLNLKANNLSGYSQIIEQDLPKPDSFNWKRWDIILAGDVFYEQPMSNEILKYLQSHANAGRLVLIGDPGRPYFPKKGVEKLFQYSFQTPTNLEQHPMYVTEIWKVIPSF